MKTRNVHRGGTTHRVDRLASTKSRAALALAVSLWIANGGVASAGTFYDVYIDAENNTQSIMHKYQGTQTDGSYPVGMTEPKINSNTQFTVTGDWSRGTLNDDAWYFYGGYSAGTTDVEGYSLVLDHAKVFYAYGGYSVQGKATGNRVTLTDSEADHVYGGYTGKGGPTPFTGGDASHNEVRLTRSTAGYVAGGVFDRGTNKATYNKVYLTDSTVNGSVWGGAKSNGSGDLVTGNELYLSGANTVIHNGLYRPGKVQNFETIFIENVKWGTPVLTFPKSEDRENPYGILQNEKRPGETEGTWATIDASNIAFSGVDALSAGETTKLIENKMANYQGTIKSGKYKLGTTLEGTGKASVSGDDLIYTIETGTAREQTHNTVMGASVSMTALSMGNEFVGAATEGLAAPANVGADGVSSFAQMGGGSMRQETGSHVDTHTWNAILALGHQNKKERGTMEYGAFFEYGTGNYTTHADNGLRGDGSARYTGGGLLAKYTMKNDVYVEGSLRAGSVHDDARNVLSDGFGNPYSYDTNAAYMGFHLGVGREIAVAGGNAVDVYGKYFYNRRNGVSFDAGGHYDLDAVTSSVIRLGARYILKCNKWNFYAGAAYEHEFDGKANGTADGVAIRGADTSGGSFRGEIGATVKPGENSPWNIDLNVSGFAGKKQGFTGGVSVALMF